MARLELYINYFVYIITLFPIVPVPCFCIGMADVGNIKSPPLYLGASSKHTPAAAPLPVRARSF